MKRSLALLCMMIAAGLGPRTARGHQAQWTIDPKPVVDIAGTNAAGDVVLEHAIAGTRVANGGIVIADQGAAGLRFFDAAGKLLRTVGRSGQGPGEFGMITWLGRCAADSLFVWDMRLRRMTVITTSGEVARQYQVSVGPYAIACSRSGVFAAQPLATRPSGPPPTTASPFARGIAAVSVIDGDGAVTRTLTDAPGVELFYTGLEGGPRGGGPRPLGRSTSLAVAGNRVFVGTADSGLVESFMLTGERAAPIKVAGTARKATKQHHERAVQDVVASAPAAARSAITQHLLALPRPEWLPSYTALLTDSDNLLWVVLSAPGDADTQLRALSQDGRERANVRIPVSLAVFEVGLDYILGAYESSDGEPHVVMYRLKRG